MRGGEQPLGEDGRISFWAWLAGPSVAMTALQAVSTEVEEAAVMDGANVWQRFWRVTLPMLKPTVFTVVTLGLIGTWQVFDQIYTGTQGGPSKTTLTPAYLSYRVAFQNGEWGRGATSLTYAVLVVVALLYVFPFLIQVATSFKTDAEATQNAVSLIPQTWTTATYERLFLRSDFPLWFRNSVTVTVTIGRVFINSLADYALARLKFRGRGVVFAGLIIPLLADAAGIFIMKNFFESIPPSVEEAARVDGAGTFRALWSIVLPMARLALVTIVILSFQGSWNELSHFIVAPQDPDLVTLAKGVAQLASGQLRRGNQYPLKLAAAAIMTIPVAVLFFIFQRRIMDQNGGTVKE